MKKKELILISSKSIKYFLIFLTLIFLSFSSKDVFLEKNQSFEFKSYQYGDAPEVLKDSHNLVYTDIDLNLTFKLDAANESQGIFSTARQNHGFRAEVSKLGLYLIIAHDSSPNKIKVFNLLSQLEIQKEYDFKLIAKKNDFIDVWLNGERVLHYEDTTINLNLSEITIGSAGLDKSRKFHGTITNISINEKTRGAWRVRHSLLIFLILGLLSFRGLHPYKNLIKDLKSTKGLKFYLITLSGVLSGLFFYIFFTSKYGFLPSPFICNKAATFMDFFNPLYDVLNNDLDKIKSSVYPPLNYFILLSINWLGNISGQELASSYHLRNTSLVVAINFIAIALLGVICSLRLEYWKKFSFVEKAMLFIMLVASTPFLFAMERGNLIMLCILPLSVFLSSKKDTIKAASYAFLVNIKPYFIILIILAIKRNYKFLACSLVFLTLLYFSSALFLKIDPMYIFTSLNSFSQSKTLIDYRDAIILSSNIATFSYFIETHEVSDYLSKFYSYYAITNLSAFFILCTYFFIFLLCGIIFLKRTVIKNTEITAALIVIISNYSVFVGPYFLILYFCLIPIFIEMRYKAYYMFFLALMALPLDLAKIFTIEYLDSFSFISNLPCHVNCAIGYGSLLRPLVNLSLMLSLFYEFLTRVKKYHKANE